MKRKYIVAVVLVAALTSAAFYLYGGSHTPAGQPPLRNLSAPSAGDLRDAFNAARNDVRVLLLLSPT